MGERRSKNSPRVRIPATFIFLFSPFLFLGERITGAVMVRDDGITPGEVRGASAEQEADWERP